MVSLFHLSQFHVLIWNRDSFVIPITVFMWCLWWWVVGSLSDVQMVGANTSNRKYVWFIAFLWNLNVLPTIDIICNHLHYPIYTLCIRCISFVHCLIFLAHQMPQSYWTFWKIWNSIRWKNQTQRTSLYFWRNISTHWTIPNKSTS